MEVIDGRDMEPPEPFERVMEAISVLQPGARVMLILTREPLPLYRALGLNGFKYETTAFPDGRFEIVISHEQGGA
jgi:tRNA 2-thiouridine synthesizing protein A